MADFSDNIVEFYERLSSWEQAVVKDSGLTLQQMHTLEVIGNHRTLRMKELAQKLGVVMGTLTIMINRLSKLELVERKISEEDRRSYHIHLTPTGEQLYQEHHQHHHLLAEEIGAILSKDEQLAFNHSLEKILKQL